MKNEDLPFWHFFQQLEKELSYERWIDKYRLFLDAIYENKIVNYDDGLVSFRRFCKILYLQNINDEAKFDQLLDKAIITEKEFFKKIFRNIPVVKDEDVKAGTETEKNTDKPKPVSKFDIPPVEPEKEMPGMKEPMETKGERSVFYNPPQSKINTELVKKQKINFLLTDEYYPVTRRQMVKGWQFVRHKEKSRLGDGIDLKKTVDKIAREGLFFEPEFNQSLRNRQDTIIIFADYRGSMAPFHELTNRLILTAKGEGGHPEAPVFYFQNFPLGYVYKKSNLDEPVKLKEALVKANRNITLAIVISDAGAARGNTDPRHNKNRVEMTEIFLSELDNACAHTIWLNPMPTHRWEGTAAELISEKVFLMTPVFDNASYNFQDTFRTVLKQNFKNTKSK